MLLDHPARDLPPTRVALTGARGDYGRTFLAQVRLTPELLPTVLVDPDVVGVVAMVTDLGIDPASTTVVDDAEAAARAVEAGRTAVVPGAHAVPWDHVDVLVEACGRVEAGHAYAELALSHGAHVVMVSKEVDTVVGVDLARRAAAAGLSYLPGDGDQPANLLRLLDWVAAVGLDVVAIGKSGEYDLVLDPATGDVTQAGVTVSAPQLLDLLELGPDVRATLAARSDAVRDLKRAAAADACEMTVVALRTGTRADVESMHYPVARIDELADVYSLVDDGGLLSHDGVVEVFSALRLPGEASFAGGVFAVVRTGDPATWELLRGKGHVLSRDGRYACLYWPYHAMGVETPLTVHAAVARTMARTPRPSVLLAARASRDLPVGTGLRVAGHHHEIDGTVPVLIDPDDAVAPYYLLDDVRTVRPVTAGELISFADVSGVAAEPLRAYRDGLTTTSTPTQELNR